MPKFSRAKLRKNLTEFVQKLITYSTHYYLSADPSSNTVPDILPKDFIRIFSKGHNSRKGDNSDKKKKVQVNYFSLRNPFIFQISKPWNARFIRYGMHQKVWHIHVIFSWTQIGRFGFTDREIGSQIGRFFRGKKYSILVSKIVNCSTVDHCKMFYLPAYC